MKNTKYILIGIIIFFAIGFIYSEFRSHEIEPVRFDDVKDLMPAVGDGEHYVQIVKIDLAKKTAVFKHINYFVGMDAFNSAVEYETECDKKDMTNCIPSLKHGYYIKPTSPESGFVMEISDSKIFLANNKNISASLEDLNKEISLPQYDSAFKINVINSKIISIEEITRYNNSETFNLPKGYTLETYKVEKTTEISCQNDNECETPEEYSTRSNCPYTSICEQNKCAVVCPEYRQNY